MLMLGAFGAVGIAAAAVLAPGSRSWRSAAEHRRVFWLAWIVGFAALGFAGPASVGLGWAPMAWLAWWSAVAAFQPSMVADLVEIHRFGRRRRALPATAVSTMVEPPTIRWRSATTPLSRAAPVGTRR